MTQSPSSIFFGCILLLLLFSYQEWKRKLELYIRGGEGSRRKRLEDGNVESNRRLDLGEAQWG